jgi:hypothetical protein
MMFRGWTSGLFGRRSAPLALALLTLGTATGCKKTDQPKPDPATVAPTASVPLSPRHTPRNGPFNRPDPAVTKDYRVDVCYYGTFSLRQVREAYLGSLGKDEPSAKKIPSFGLPAQPSATPAPTPPGVPPPASAAPKPPAPTPAPVKPGASASAPVPVAAPPMNRELLMRMPHERNARSCSAAVPLKEPAMGDVDAQLAIFAPFALDLARDITVAQQYYQREEYTKDSFAKGKELDKKLREGFAKLDDLSDKLGAALDAWRKAHPPDLSKAEEGEKISRAAIDDARDVLVAVAHKKADGEAWKGAIDKLDKSAAALKTFADGHATDTWSRIIAGPLEGFVKTVKAGKITADKSFDPESYLQLVTGYTSLLDARQRAFSRSAHPVNPAEPVPGHPPIPAPQAPAEPPK